MNKHFFSALFLIGALALLWVAAGFFPTHGLALAVTLLIALVYGLGALELWRFRQATAGLNQALAAIPEDLSELGTWLAGVPVALQNPVRLRIEGERVALPGPALTPYLVGLLVMLGMLGTFLGMVVTLNGAVFALEGTPDLAAIRSAFAAPIRGLGLAFGTSVAGVASSAILGLLSTLCRRERLQAAQTLDSKMATQLRSFSHTWQRQQTWLALQQQAQALPAVATQLQMLVAQIERMGQQTSETLRDNQHSFHSSVSGVYTALARNVDQSLRESLAQSAHLAGASLQPVVESAMRGMALEARQLHERTLSHTQAQMEALATRIDASANAVATRWTAALGNVEGANARMLEAVGQSLATVTASLAQRTDALLRNVQDHATQLQAAQAGQDAQRLQAWHTALKELASGLHSEWQQASAQAQHSASQMLTDITRLLASSEQLVHARIATEAEWAAQQGARMEQLTAQLRGELGALRTDEAARGQAAVERLGELQTAVTGHLGTLGRALEDPITRLIATASEAPRAAAEVIGQLRQEISHSVARDNALLEERGHIMETLNSLLAGINHASIEQRAVIDTLVANSAQALENAGSQFSEKAAAEATRLADSAAQVGGSAVELSTLGETLGFAVRAFHEGNAQLLANLQRIEAALDKSMTRSDEQLAYYVAQAREVIDLGTMSQKEMVDALRQVANRQGRIQGEMADEAA
jgi:hypothetical protein